MRYRSTRSPEPFYTFREALLQGRPKDGGFFVPESLPVLADDFLESLGPLNFASRCQRLLAAFAPKEDPRALQQLCEEAFSETQFPEGAPKALVFNDYAPTEPYVYANEGPSGSYLDYGLALHHALQSHFYEGEALPCYSSGTAPASGRALAYLDLEAGKALRLLLSDARSRTPDLKRLREALDAESLQSLRFIHLQGELLEAERAVLGLYEDRRIQEGLAASKIRLLPMDGSSIADLLAAMALIISALADLHQAEHLDPARAPSLSLPMVGALLPLAALYVKTLGLPLGRVVVYGHRKRALVDFLRQGRYEIKPMNQSSQMPLAETLWPVNLERLVFELMGRQEEAVLAALKDLEEGGSMAVDRSTVRAWSAHITGRYVQEREAIKALKALYDRSDYAVDVYNAMSFVSERSKRRRRRPEPVEQSLRIGVENPLLALPLFAEAIFGRRYMKGRSFEVLELEAAEETGVPLIDALKQAPEPLLGEAMPARELQKQLLQALELEEGAADLPEPELGVALLEETEGPGALEEEDEVVVLVADDLAGGGA